MDEHSTEHGSVVDQTASQDTRDLLERLARADPAAWTTLLDRVEDRLRVLLRFRLDPATRAIVDPEDLLQDVFVDAFSGLDRFEYRGPGSLQSWFCGILFHRLSAARRSAGRLPRPGAAPFANQFGGGDERSLVRRRLADWITSRSSATRPSESARRLEQVERVHAALAELPEAERDVLLLVLYEGLNGREAAERLGVDPSTVSVRMKRGLAACATRLKDLAP